MKRRQFLHYFGAAMATPTLLSACSSSSDGNHGMMGGMNTSTSANLNYIKNQPLSIPPLYEGTLNNNGIQEYDLTIKASTHTIANGLTTQTWSVNPPNQTLAMLGPTLKLVNGQRVKINYINQLAETTTMHGHGMHVPAAMDGGPHQPIAPNTTWTADYTVKQKACTSWYHPHAMGSTAEQVYKGLAGMMIIEDSESATNGLPIDYGVDDIPLVLQDRVIDANGQFSYAPSMREKMWGYRGNIWLCNGQIEPTFTAKAGLLRLRLLNGSNAGIYMLSFSNGASFHLVATDGALLQSPVALSQIRLTPGERAEIVLDLTHAAGQIFALQAKEEELNITKTFLNITVSNTVGNKTAVPSTLTTLTLPSSANAVRTRTFSLGMAGMGKLTINGAQMNKSIINENVPLNDLEIWEISNPMPMPHNFHIHATHFVPLDRNGSVNSLEKWEKNGYKDVIYLPANSTVRFLVKMTDYVDSVSPYMYHCHILEHEDGGMMGQFTVA